MWILLQRAGAAGQAIMWLLCGCVLQHAAFLTIPCALLQPFCSVFQGHFKPDRQTDERLQAPAVCANGRHVSSDSLAPG